MNEIKLFENVRFGQIHISLDVNLSPLFCLSDLCRVIGLSNNRSVAQRLDDDDVRKVYTIDNLGRRQQVIYVTEAGMYDTLIRSNSKQVKPFRRWICSEVLPSIRKSGGYMVDRPEETPEDLMARALKVANETLARREARLRQLEDANKAQEQQLKAAAPKVEYVDNVLQSVNTYTVQQIAKELDTTAHRLYEFLKTQKVMFRQSGTWMLNAKYNGKGYTKTRTYQYTRNDGTCCTSAYTVFTEAGRAFIHSIYNNLNRQNDEQ